MQSLGRVSILAVSLLLSGCKADQATHTAEQIDARSTDLPPQPNAGPAPAAEANSTSALKDGRPVIACFGDSLTAGYGADQGAAYPDFLQAGLDQQGYKYRVVNEGISGNTTKDGIARLDQVIALKPTLVLVEFGGNDGLRGVPIKDSRANLDLILARLKAARIHTALLGITLPPEYGPDYIAQFNATYPLLAKKYNIPLLPFLLKDVYGVPGLMQADNIHATDGGNKVVAANVLSLVTPLLAR